MSSTNPKSTYPSLPEIGPDVIAMVTVLRSIREALQIYERKTQNKLDSFVRLEELVELGLAEIHGTQITRPALIDAYADDAAAAQGGVPIGGFYRIGNAVQVRIT